MKHLKEFTRINEATSGGFFTEAKGYSDSGEFTDEFYDLFAQVTKMKKVMKNQKWIDYMKMSDYQNLNNDCEDAARDAIRAVVNLETALQAIDKVFDRMNGNDDGDDLGGDSMGDGVDPESTDEDPVDAPAKPPRGASSRNK